MYALLTIALLLAVPLLMVVLHLRRRRFAYFWLVAAFGAIGALPLAVLMRPLAPQEISLGTWQPLAFFPLSPALLLDSISWPFALSMVILALSVILTDVSRLPDANWLSWAGELALAALGVFAVLAGNPLTLLLAWAAIDVIEAVLLLGQIIDSGQREQVAIAFAPRLAGIVMLVAASLVAQSGGQPLTFQSISPRVSVYLLLAAGLRLGIFPLHAPVFRGLTLRRGFGTSMRMVPFAASLVLLARTATAGVSPGLATVLTLLIGISALIASLSWITARDELDGRPYWILCTAAFAAAAAVRGEALASLTWSLVGIFSGGMLFLASARSRYLLPVVILGFLGVSTLPLTQSWNGVRLYSSPTSILLAPFLLANGLLLAGYLRFALRPGEPLSAAERWVQAIYPAGLAILPLAHLLVTYGSPAGFHLPALPLSLYSLVPIALVEVIYLLSRRQVAFPGLAASRLHQVFTLTWFYRLLWGFYNYLGRMIRLVNTLLEGEGGILWTLLLLTLLVSIFTQLRLGG